MTSAVSPRAALAALPERARLIASPGMATPQTLLAALGRESERRPGHVLNAGLLLGELPFLASVVAGALEFRSWHIPAAARSAAAQGRVEYVPVRASELTATFRDGFDAALIRVSAPDNHGYCSLGPSLTYTREAIAAARLVIAEIDPQLPRTHGYTDIHLSRLDRVVDVSDPTGQYRPAPPTEASRMVAANVVEILRPGAVLQLGIGAIPEAVAEQLTLPEFAATRFVGMVTQRMADLVGHRGGPPALRAVELMGGPALLSYADGNRTVRLQGSVDLHDPCKLATEASFTSVNSALAIDLSGQVAAEGIGGRIVAGIGGSVDFFEGAGRAAGGQRIIALSARSPGGVSTIVREFPAGTPITIPRHLVDVVATEYGVTRLAGRSERERTEALIGLAAPEYRDALAE